jgi:hypothetical protein
MDMHMYNENAPFVARLSGDLVLADRAKEANCSGQNFEN